MTPPNLSPLRPEISVADFDRGQVDVVLKYRRGLAPEGYPHQLTLTVPHYRQVADLVAAFMEAPNPWLFVFACLPESKRDDAFLNLLAYDCLSVLIESSMVLVFGWDLYQRILANTLVDPPALRPANS